MKMREKEWTTAQKFLSREEDNKRLVYAASHKSRMVLHELGSSLEGLSKRKALKNMEKM